jgi:hypothetical protein
MLGRVHFVAVSRAAWIRDMHTAGNVPLGYEITLTSGQRGIFMFCIGFEYESQNEKLSTF